MIAPVEPYSVPRYAARRTLLCALLLHAVVLGLGAAGLATALNTGQLWGWALAALALAAGVANVEHLACSAAALAKTPPIRTIPLDDYHQGSEP